MAASDQSQSTILDQLKAVNRGLRVERINNRGRVVEKRTDERLEGPRHAFLVVAKRRVRKGAKNTQPRLCFPCSGESVRRKGEGGIQCNA